MDDTAALSDVLKDYQQNGASDHAEARLAIALTRVVENGVQPSLIKKLRPQDVDDVCSEIILGFWQFRHSVRPDEVGKLIQTLKHRRMTDQVREYYREDDYHAREPAAGERELLALLPARDGKPGTEAGQDVWELLYDLKLSDQDHLVAYTLYLGIDKQIIGKLLGLSGNAVTRSIKRCREALEGVNREVGAAVVDRSDGQHVRYKRLRQILNDPARRKEYSDYAEEQIQRQSARYSRAMLERAAFYSELVMRESKRLKGKEQLDALAMLNDQFPRIVDAIENVMDLDDSACLAKFGSNIAHVLRMQGKLELGASVFKRLLNMAEKTGNRLLEIKAGTSYGQFVIRTGRFDQANEILTHAFGLAQIEGNEEALANVLNALGNVTRYLGRYEESAEFYNQSLKHGRNLRDGDLISNALSNLGCLAGMQRRLDNARELFTESLERVRETGNIHSIAGDLHNLAHVAAEQGDYHEAQKLYLEALELNRLIGNRLYEGFNLSELATIALEQGRFAEAKQLYASAQAIAAQIGNEMHFAVCEYRLGSVAAATEAYEDARRHFETGIQLAQKTGEKYRLGCCLADLGALHCDLGEYQAAEPLLSEALAIGKDIGDTHLSSTAFTGLALVALATGKLPKATGFIIQALNLAAEAGMPRTSLEAFRAGVLLLAKADQASRAMLLACGVIRHLKRIGLVFSRKWYRDLDDAIAECNSMLEAEKLHELEQQAESMSIEDLTEYALQALENLQAKLV